MELDENFQEEDERFSFWNYINPLCSRENNPKHLFDRRRPSNSAMPIRYLILSYVQNCVKQLK